MSTYAKKSIDNAASDAFIADAVARHMKSDSTKPTRTPVIYVNESNGIQALPILADMGIVARFCYIRSTHFEQKRGSAAICDLPDDLLLSCAMGDDVLIIDYGTRKDRSRAIYQGVPFVKYCLDRIWLDHIPDKVSIYPRTNTLERKQDAARCFDEWFSLLGRKAQMKLGAYRDIACENLLVTNTSVLLSGVSAATTHDGDKLYYANLKRDYFARMQGATRP